MIKNYNDWSNSSLTESVQFPIDRNKIEQILRYYEIENYSIKDDGTVDVDGDIYFYREEFEYFPVKFGIVNGVFYCNHCYNLKTLEGAPEKCKYFRCEAFYNLKTLKGAPKECIFFICSWCKNLESLEGAPEKCKAFECSYCINLETLKGAPKECEEFNCAFCSKLKTFEGAPRECKIFNCRNCILLNYSLSPFPKCKEVDMQCTPFETLHNKIGNNNFINLINAKESTFKFESILAIGLSRGLNFEKDIKPLLKDRTITEEAFKYKYRGVIAGERFRF